MNVAERWTDNMVKLLIAAYSEHKRSLFEPVAVASSGGGIKRKAGKEENAKARNLSPGESKRPKKLISALELQNNNDMKKK
ncbi:hypothetical protein JTB14_013558 [Gonioctena quinquepunctata]|nr:hypothetical protein JTB14_013558 [Gonioctena quinquepunctata]